MKLASARVRRREISWCPSYRIIPAKYPPVQIFEQISDIDDLQALLQIEAMTDDVARQMLGNLKLFSHEDKITGRGAGRIMPCFLIFDQESSENRFSNSEFGAYYAGREFETAIKETIFHRQKFLAQTVLPAQDIDNVLILADIKGQMHDIRGKKRSYPDLYHASNYADSQVFAHDLKKQGSFGIVYDSVRNANGQCVAVLRPQVIANCRDSGIITYIWDGAKITGYYEKSDFESL